MILNDNVIDYVHWDDLQQARIVYDCSTLRTERATIMHAHNEMMSIIDEELCEAGLIIN